MAENTKNSSGSQRGGTSEQHAEAGRQSHKNDAKNTTSKSSSGGSGNRSSSSSSRSSSGGSASSNRNAPTGSGQGWHGDSKGHAEAGRQSHKNDDK